MFRRIWGSRRARIFTSAGVVAVLLAGTGGGVAIAQAITHQEALTEARAAVEAATDARQSAADARRIHGLAVAALETELAAVEQLDLDKLASVLGAELVDEVRTAAAEARETFTADAERVPADVEEIPAAEEGLSSRELEEVTRDAAAAGKAWALEQHEFEEGTEALRGAGADVDEAMQAAAAKGPDAAAAVLATATLADEASKSALTAAAAALEAADDPAPAFAPFLAAVDAVNSAHAAEQARQAEEAARAAQGTPGRSGSGSRGGGGGGSAGGGGGGGGSAGGGSTGGGGGSTPPVDTRRYADPRGPYTPGCALGGMLYAHDPGPGGTSVIGSVSIPYDYRIAGDLVKVYACQ